MLTVNNQLIVKHLLNTVLFNKSLLYDLYLLQIRNIR